MLEPPSRHKPYRFEYVLLVVLRGKDITIREALLRYKTTLTVGLLLLHTDFIWILLEFYDEGTNGLIISVINNYFIVRTGYKTATDLYLNDCIFAVTIKFIK